MALEQFVGQDTPTGARRAAIHQGDIYWVQLEGPDESAGIPHPHVVVQADVLNHSRLSTVVVCALTSNVQRASLPGNVLLDVGEAGLTRPSVVEVSKVSSVEKAQLGDYIGSLTAPRVDQILAGMQFLQRSFFAR
jgi:mRNA interferase MazF